MLAVYRRASVSCELESFRDRRAFLGLALDRAGSVPSMIELYSMLARASDRTYVRSAILSRVRSTDDLRAARSAFGAGRVDFELVERTLEAAKTDDARLVAMRQLVERYGEDLDLSLRLLEMLERATRPSDAKRWAERLRRHPLADAGVRTAIGEMYLRMGDEDEARRVFSEIVEFAPHDELARRRLGDLYRAHAWYEEAYRQYQTLASIRPDDPSVLLLIAQAAAGAGRIDEALRLEQRLAETAQPGGASGTARTAILWSSVRLAELRKAARARNDEERLRAYLGRMRRGGVLREARALRASLTWSHPDANLSLWAAHPGLSVKRPSDIAPEFGIEAFDLETQEPGVYRIEVLRRSGGS
ncbi:MAG: tetratricopeptide repeat protein, partial [Polyangiaceae bacterium]|nr:tetratricopeptide repeat protein [Polyangiaceae bacterium]